jgi:hypothetical protein
MKSSIGIAGAVLGAIVATISGCGDDAGPTNGGVMEGEGEVGVISQAQTGWPSLIQAWTPPGPQHDVFLEPTNTHICVLTRVYGKFASLNQTVRLTVEVLNGVATWKLVGVAGLANIGAEAMCFRKDQFLTSGHNPTPGGTATSHVLNQVDPGAWYTGGSCTVVSNFGSQPGFSNMKGKAFTMIRGMGGGFFGWGNMVRTIQGHNTNDSNQATASACANPNTDNHFNNVDAFVTSFRTLDVNEHPARFKGPGGVVGTAAQVGTFEIQGDSAGYFTTLPVAQGEAFCAFTRIEGYFNGGAEDVQLGFINGNWAVRAKSLSNPKISASVRCYLRDQRTPCPGWQASQCAAFGCGCADGACSGGICDGGGCTDQEVSNCGYFGCGCTMGQCRGYPCPE